LTLVYWPGYEVNKLDVGGIVDRYCLNV